MQITRRLVILFLCLLLSAPALFGRTLQDKQPDSQSRRVNEEDVLIVIQQGNVHFSTQRAVTELRLQVVDEAGTLIYDSEPVPALQLNWTLQDSAGHPVRSGLYAYTLSLKGAETIEARVRRGHIIIDRGRERSRNSDRLWVTSQNDTGVGVNLTVARDEGATVAGADYEAERTDGRQAENPERDENDPSAGAGTKEQKPSRSVAASTSGQIAKFTGSNNELGDSVISEATGNIGIGTTSPTYKFDVTGNLRAVRSTSNDLVVQTTGGTNAWARTWMITPSQRWAIGTAQEFNGNQFYLLDDTFGHVRMSIQPNAGEVAFPSPSSNQIVAQTNGGTNAWAQFRMKTSNQTWGMGTSQNYLGDQFYLFDVTRNQTRLMIQPNGGAIAFPLGHLGIGTQSPATNLHVQGTGAVEALIRSSNERAILSLSNGLGPTNYVWTLESGVGGNFPSLFGIYNRTLNKSGLEIDGNLLVSVKALQITGGADLSESFDVGATPDLGRSETQPGMVVTIDPANPGKLMVSSRAYDRRVAGVVSGAGGVKPGVVMGHEGTLADGKRQVALSGRVYALVDAARGSIRPGDLLTTSPTPGHAMKAVNSARAQGAIIGKAMTGLKRGRGLVLVLVTLQ